MCLMIISLIFCSVGSLAHTGYTNTWWQVTLLEPSYILYINVFGRTDSCCQDRIQGSRVLVDDTLIGTVQHVSGVFMYHFEAFEYGTYISTLSLKCIFLEFGIYKEIIMRANVLIFFNNFQKFD